MLGSFASLIGLQFVRVKEGGKPESGPEYGDDLYDGASRRLCHAVVVLVSDIDVAALWATLAGLVTGVVIGFTSDFFTGDDRPTRRGDRQGLRVRRCDHDHHGFSYGLISIVPSIISIVVAMLIAYFAAEASPVLTEVYGVGIAAVGTPALDHRHDRLGGCLRPDRGQCPRHCRDGRDVP